MIILYTLPHGRVPEPFKAKSRHPRFRAIKPETAFSSLARYKQDVVLRPGPFTRGFVHGMSGVLTIVSDTAPEGTRALFYTDDAASALDLPLRSSDLASAK
jgi:hypothetical protein